MSTIVSRRTGAAALGAVTAVLLVVLALLPARPAAHAPAPPAARPGFAVTAAQDPGSEASLLETVRENLRRERALLLEYVYRERRQPMHISPFGKVSVGPEQLFEIYPTGDPDRPRRVLLSIGNRPATAEEQAEFARRHARDVPEAASRRAEETRRRAQERFDDAFRVYRFELKGTETVDGVPVRAVTVTPRPGVVTRSDLGKWMKRFRGTAWISDEASELLRLEMVATDTISLGWGVVGRIAEGTRITYVRRPVGDGVWLPSMARFEARGRTLLFRSFEIDSRTEWFDYRPHVPARAPDVGEPSVGGRGPLR